ncbi:MAG: ATP-binding protein [Bacilli bacterium]
MSFYCDYKVEPNCMEFAGAVSSDVKKKLKAYNIKKSKIREIAIACYEAEINIVIHSCGGHVYARIEKDMVELQFIDQGPGIEDLDVVLVEGYSTASEFARENGFGAGLGLPNIKAVADEFDLQSSPDGTTLIVRFYLNENDIVTK